MKRSLSLFFLATAAILLAGCCPNGCFVLTGDAYRALAHPEPIRKRWERANTPDAQRQTDWQECGGSGTGNFSPESSLVDRVKSRYGVNELKAQNLIFHDVQRCMLRKGYHYTGSCHLEVLREMPGCGAP